jgi:hypothetical protein
MEKLTSFFKKEGLSSKVLKALILVVGMSMAEKAVAQGTMEDLISKAKKIELDIAQKAAKGNALGTVNNVPTASLSGNGKLTQVSYSDDSRQHATGFLVHKEGKYYWDRNGDGKTDGVYLDKNEGHKEVTDVEIAQKLLFMSSPSETELSLSSITGENFVYFDLSTSEYKIYDSSAGEVSKVGNDEKAAFETKLQEKFVQVLTSE